MFRTHYDTSGISGRELISLAEKSWRNKKDEYLDGDAWSQMTPDYDDSPFGNIGFLAEGQDPTKSFKMVLGKQSSTPKNKVGKTAQHQPSLDKFFNKVRFEKDVEMGPNKPPRVPAPIKNTSNESVSLSVSEYSKTSLALSTATPPKAVGFYSKKESCLDDMSMQSLELSALQPDESVKTDGNKSSKASKSLEASRASLGFSIFSGKSDGKKSKISEHSKQSLGLSALGASKSSGSKISEHSKQSLGLSALGASKSSGINFNFSVGGKFNNMWPDSMKRRDQNSSLKTTDEKTRRQEEKDQLMETLEKEHLAVRQENELLKAKLAESLMHFERIKALHNWKALSELAIVTTEMMQAKQQYQEADRERTDLRKKLESYETLIAETEEMLVYTDNYISESEENAASQDERIAYLEVRLLQNGIAAIDDDQKAKTTAKKSVNSDDSFYIDDLQNDSAASFAADGYDESTSETYEVDLNDTEKEGHSESQSEDYEADLNETTKEGHDESKSETKEAEFNDSKLGSTLSNLESSDAPNLKLLHGLEEDVSVTLSSELPRLGEGHETSTDQASTAVGMVRHDSMTGLRLEEYIDNMKSPRHSSSITKHSSSITNGGDTWAANSTTENALGKKASDNLSPVPSTEGLVISRSKVRSKSPTAGRSNRSKSPTAGRSNRSKSPTAGRPSRSKSPTAGRPSPRSSSRSKSPRAMRKQLRSITEKTNGESSSEMSTTLSQQKSPMSVTRRKPKGQAINFGHSIGGGSNHKESSDQGFVRQKISRSSSMNATEKNMKDYENQEKSRSIGRSNSVGAGRSRMGHRKMHKSLDNFCTDELPLPAPSSTPSESLGKGSNHRKAVMQKSLDRVCGDDLPQPTPSSTPSEPLGKGSSHRKSVMMKSLDKLCGEDIPTPAASSTPSQPLGKGSNHRKAPTTVNTIETNIQDKDNQEKTRSISRSNSVGAGRSSTSSQPLGKGSNHRKSVMNKSLDKLCGEDLAPPAPSSTPSQPLGKGSNHRKSPMTDNTTEAGIKDKDNQEKTRSVGRSNSVGAGRTSSTSSQLVGKGSNHKKTPMNKSLASDEFHQSAPSSSKSNAHRRKKASPQVKSRKAPDRSKSDDTFDKTGFTRADEGGDENPEDEEEVTDAKGLAKRKIIFVPKKQAHLPSE